LNRPPLTRTFFRRWLDNFVALPDRLRLPLAVLLAVLVHGLVLLTIWVWPFAPKKVAEQPTPTPTPTPKPLEIVIVTPTPKPPPPPEVKLTPAEEAQLAALFAELPVDDQRDYLDVEGLAKKKNLSKRALLESWQDSVAGSTKKGNGADPLPSQEGRDLPFTSFANQRANVGDPKKAPSAETPPEKKPFQIPGTDVGPLFQPLPTTKATPDPKHPEKIAETAKVTPPQPVPTPEPTPAPVLAAKPTPPPNLKRVVEAKADEIPMFVQGPNLAAKLPEPDPTPEPEPKPTPPPKVVKPTPVPVAVAEPKVPEPRPTPVPIATPPPKQVAKAAATPPPRTDNTITASKVPLANRPVPVPNPGYTPHMEKRKIDGGNAPGENGVDAVATNRGRYVKSLSQVVGSRWTYYVRDARQASLITEGVVTLKFALNAKGKIVRVQVTENSSNSAHAALCERAFLESQTDLDPPPPELLRNGVFEDTFNFRLY
jgi:outer membrane biosynthesis protein TonB